jgi:Terminase small subunit
MPILPNAKHEQFAQLCAAGLSRSAAYRKAAGSQAGKNADANSDDWLNARGVRERIRELQERNSRKSEMTREELLTFYADVIRTPADQVPAGSPVIQAYERDSEGRVKLRICDKAAAGGQLAKMCGWSEPDRIKFSSDDTLTSYLLDLRAKPIGGTVISFEQKSLHLENGKRGEENHQQGASE